MGKFCFNLFLFLIEMIQGLFRLEPLTDWETKLFTLLWIALVAHIEQQLKTVAADTWNKQNDRITIKYSLPSPTRFHLDSNIYFQIKPYGELVMFTKKYIFTRLTWPAEAGEDVFSDGLLTPEPEPVILHSCHRQRLSRVEHSSGLRLI